jgi:hypothetical protein
MRFNETRYIPEGSTERRLDGCAAVAYCRDGEGRFYAIGYRGKSNKSAFNLMFRTAEQRDRHVTTWLEGVKASEAARVERREAARVERANFKTSLKPGDIMSYSWGYEQTNVEFFKVIKVNGRCTVTVVAIASRTVEETGFMSETVAPVPEKECGQPFRARVTGGSGSDGLVGKHFQFGWCGKWNGKPEHASHYA